MRSNMQFIFDIIIKALVDLTQKIYFIGHNNLTFFVIV